MSFFTINGTFIDGFENIEHFDTPIVKSSRSPKISKKKRSDSKLYPAEDLSKLDPSKYNLTFSPSSSRSSSPSKPYLLPRIKRPSRKHNIPKPRSYMDDYLTPQFKKLEQELKSQFAKVPTSSLLFLPNDDGNLSLLNRNSSEIDQLNPFRFFDAQNNNCTLGIKSNNDICITKKNKTICIPDQDFSETKSKKTSKKSPKASPKKKTSKKSPKASPKKKTPKKKSSKKSPKASPKKKTPKKKSSKKSPKASPKKKTPKKKSSKKSPKASPKKKTPKKKSSKKSSKASPKKKTSKKGSP